MRGDAPVVVAGVEEGSLAEVGDSGSVSAHFNHHHSLLQLSCMLPGDYLIGIDGTDVR